MSGQSEETVWLCKIGDNCVGGSCVGRCTVCMCAVYVLYCVLWVSSICGMYWLGLSMVFVWVGVLPYERVAG